MANRRRGEVDAVVEGRSYRLCLTLGSLAELEDAFGVEDLGALAGRFAGGRLSARDLVRLFGAGVRGAGLPVTDAEIGALPVADALAEVAAAVSALLDVTFGDASAHPPAPQPA